MILYRVIDLLHSTETSELERQPTDKEKQADSDEQLEA